MEVLSPLNLLRPTACQMLWQAFSFDMQSHLSEEAWPHPLYRWWKWGSGWPAQDQPTCYLEAVPQLLVHSPELVRTGAFQSIFWPLNFPPKDFPGTSLVVQWLRIHHTMQLMWAQSLIRELRFPRASEVLSPWAATTEAANREPELCN